MSEKIEGLSLSLDLDYSRIDEGMKGLKRELSVVNSEFNANLSAFQRGEESIERYQVTIEGLNKKLEIQSKIVEQAKEKFSNLKKTHEEQSEALTRANRRVEEANDRYERLSKTTNVSKKELDEARKEVQESEKAFEKLSKQALVTQKELDNSAKSANNEVRILNNLQHSIENTSKKFEEFKNNQHDVDEGNHKLSKSFDAVAEHAAKASEKFKTIGKGMTASITAPLTGIGIVSKNAFYEVDEGLDIVTTATGATGKELDNLQNNFKNVFSTFPGDAQQVGGVLGEVNTRLGLTGKDLENATKEFLEFSDITKTDGVQAVQLITRAMGDAGVSANDYSKVLDSMARASQVSGISIDKLAENVTKYGAPMRSLGFEMKESISLFSQWEKAGVNTEIAFSGLKKAISNWGAAGKNPRVEFKKTLDQIKKAPDISTATSLAIKAFGAKAGPDLADAIKQGRFSIEDMNKALKTSSGTVDKTFKSTQDGAEKFKVANNNLKLGLSEIWASIEDAFGPVLQSLSNHIKDVSKWFGGLSSNTRRLIVIFGVVAAAIGPTLWALGSFIGALKKIKDVFGLLSGIGKVGKIFSLFTNPIGIAILAIGALVTAFVVAYKKSETFRNFVDKAFEGIKKAANSFGKFIGPVIKKSFNGLINLGKSIGNFLKGFWNENGNTIIQNLKNIATVISKIIKFIFSIFYLVFPKIKIIVKTVFGSLVGIIKGFITIVSGLIKVFSGLFTGNWKKLFQGLKQIFKGAFQVLWNIIKISFFGLIVKGLISFVKLFTFKIKNLWLKISSFFSQYTKNIYNSTVGRFKAIYNVISKIIVSLITFIITKSLSFYKGIVTIFKRIYEKISNIIGNLRDWLVNTWQLIKEKTREAVFNLKDRMISTFSNLKDKVLNFTEKIKNGFVGMKDKVIDTAKELAEGLKKYAIGGINKMIDGINWIGDKLGMGKEIIKPIKLSTGTASIDDGVLSESTLAIVNDKGPGNGPNGYYQELLQSPSGDLYAPQGENVPVYIPKGWGVYNGAQTYAMQQSGVIPRLSIGSGIMDTFNKAVEFGSNIKDKVVETASNVYEWASEKIGDVMDYISDPGKLIDKIIDVFGVNFKGIKEIPSKLINGMFKKIKAGAVDFVKKWFEEVGNADGSSFTKFGINMGYYPNGGAPNYSFANGHHYGIDYATPYGTLITAPTSGTVSRQYNQYGGLIARLVSGIYAQYFLHLSEVLKTGRVEQGEPIARTGNSGQWTTGPHLHYQVESPFGAELTNRNTINPAKFLSEHAGGGSGAEYARKSILRAQSILGGQYNSSYITEQMMRVAKRESNYTANAVNDWDVNAQNGTPSKGMFQMIEPSFRTYAIKGHSNIMNPVDEAISAMRYIVGTYGWNGFKRAGDYAYANGGLVTHHQIAEIGEGNKPEMIIPLTKPQRALQLIRKSQEIIGHKPENKTSIYSNDNTSMVMLLEENNELLKLLITTIKNKDFNVDIEKMEKAISEKQMDRYRLIKLMGGGA